MVANPQTTEKYFTNSLCGAVVTFTKRRGSCQKAQMESHTYSLWQKVHIYIVILYTAALFPIRSTTEQRKVGGYDILTGCDEEEPGLQNKSII